MIYGYIRVSTDKQTCKNQKLAIREYCKAHRLRNIQWVSETISGTKKPDKRKLGKLLNVVQTGDTIICTELSRLGRSLMMILNVLQELLERGVKVIAIKEGYELGDNIQSKVLAFAFSLAAEIERQLISQRTKEALALRKTQGVVLGRPKGRKNSLLKLSGKEQEVEDLLNKKISKAAIGRIFDVHRITVDKFIKERLNNPAISE